MGEGKSSVLNMIEEDLSQNDDILIVKFNPWRFKNEETLILNYFINISKSLDKELNSKKEKIGKFLTKYGSIGSVINLDLSKIGESFSDSDIEELKERVNDFLKESNKKVVVIIDDIDRLDKQELFAIFKLIKLTGDFSNTYYILSFDDEMVASSIGERYAEGNKESRHNFLEKIIQVPLRIPKALSNDLLNYTFQLINEVLNTNGIDLKQEASDVGYQISQNLLLRITTPRLAIRYANSLSFLIPLLKGEVNIVDLIIFEGIKLFYPNHYDFIKNSPEYFIESYEKSYLNSSDTKKKEEFKQKLDSINKNLSKKEQEGILNLLKKLFPIIKEALDNYSYAYGNHNWTKEKRIVSAKYFNRFFLYSIPDNDISDVYFEEYLAQLENQDIEEIEKETNEILKTIDTSDFLSKINLYLNELTWNQRKIFIKILCTIQDKFEGIKGGTFNFGFNPKAQAAITINKLLEENNDYDERFEFIKTLLKTIDFDFSFEIIRWIITGNKDKEKLFKSEDIHKIEDQLLEKAIEDSDKNNSNIFENYSNHIYKLLSIWHRKSPQKLKKYIDNFIKKDNDFPETIIEVLTSTIYSSSYPEPYKTDFKEESYDILKEYYDIDKLYKFFSKRKYQKIRNLEVKFFEPDRGYTKENAIRQFIHWYELKKTQNFEEAQIVE